jgi:hypothetical protein
MSAKATTAGAGKRGWMDDPRAYYFWIKKKGYTATAIRKFCEIIG